MTQVTPRRIQGLGCIPDQPDRRDALLPLPVTATLPARVDLRESPFMPPVLDQQSLGSCTANAIGSLVQFVRRRESLADFQPSRLFLYYNERSIEGTCAVDAGAQIRDGLKSANADGVVDETLWPYDLAQFAVKPSPEAYAQAKEHRTLRYYRIGYNLEHMKLCLVHGFPFVFGFSVYDSFESYEVEQTGVLNLPQQSERLLGGHAVLAVGFDDATQRFIVRNSWGAGWGQQGYFTIPYQYLLIPDLASDYWTIRLSS